MTVRIPVIRQDLNVSGPSGQRNASASDFEPGLSAELSADRADAGAASGAMLAQVSADQLSGKAAQALGSSLGEASDALYKWQANKEQSDASAKVATMHGKWAAEIPTRLKSAQPGDSKFVSGILSDFDKQAEGLSDGYETNEARQYVQKSLASLRGDIFAKSAVAQGELAAQEKINNLNTAATQYSAASFHSPGDALQNIKAFRSAVELTRKDIGYDKAADIERSVTSEIALQGMMGRVRDNWRGAVDEIASGKWDEYLDGGKQAQVVSAARAVQAREREEADRARIIRNQEMAMAENSTMLHMINDIRAGGNPNIAAVPWKNASHAMTLYNFLDHQKEEAAKAADKSSYGAGVDAVVSMLPTSVQAIVKDVTDASKRLSLGQTAAEIITKGEKAKSEATEKQAVITGIKSFLDPELAKQIPVDLPADAQRGLASFLSKLKGDTKDEKTKAGVDKLYTAMKNGQLDQYTFDNFEGITEEAKRQFEPAWREARSQRMREVEQGMKRLNAQRVWMPLDSPDASAQSLKTIPEINERAAREGWTEEVRKDAVNELEKLNKVGVTAGTKLTEAHVELGNRINNEKGANEVRAKIASGELADIPSITAWVRTNKYGVEVMDAAGKALKDFHDPEGGQARAREESELFKLARGIIVADSPFAVVQNRDIKEARDGQFQSYVRREVERIRKEDPVNGEAKIRELMDNENPKGFLAASFKYKINDAVYNKKDIAFPAVPQGFERARTPQQQAAQDATMPKFSPGPQESSDAFKARKLRQAGIK